MKGSWTLTACLHFPEHGFANSRSMLILIHFSSMDCFLLGITIILQIITGIFLGLHYTSDLNSAYSSVFFFIREIYYGWCLRYLHSSGASFVFLFLFLHLGRAISYGSYFYNPNTWFSGILIFFFLILGSVDWFLHFLMLNLNAFLCFSSVLAFLVSISFVVIIINVFLSYFCDHLFNQWKQHVINRKMKRNDRVNGPKVAKFLDR